ncbi:MAG: HD domain-containing protein [Thiobacillus sp.]|nr:HD domain-containing protein [Thiobacillus sp.]
MGNPQIDTLVLDAMRLAERAHRTRQEGPHHRKAPEGEDRPAYFIHLAEVAWMLQDAGLDAETVAAGFLHDIIEDCGYSHAQLAQDIGNNRVAEIVKWVSEDKTDPTTGEKLSWEVRNKGYIDRLQTAADNVRALSCADKTSNMRDMNRLLAKGHSTSAFTKQDHATQLNKFESLYTLVFEGHVPAKLTSRYQAALNEFRQYGK